VIPPKSDDTASWLVRARRELGVREIVGARHNPRVLEYHQATKLKAVTDEVAWCAAFVCWCLEQEGVRSTKSAAAASFKDWGRASLLNPGAVIVFGKHDPDAKGSGHVGFCNAFAKDGWVEVLSGNQGNSVTLKKYLVSSIVACRWPTF
jgi:uncharacterized protein (TIGR02594 family)